MAFAFVTFIAVSLAALASPGPAFLAMVHQTQNRSRRGCILFALGLASIATFWCGLAFFGLTAVFDIVPWLHSALKLAGGVYLVYLAVNTWRRATSALTDRTPELPTDKYAFFQGCAINLANPKSVLFAASVLLTIFPPDLSLFYKVAVLATLFMLETGFYSALTFGLHRPSVHRAYLGAKKSLDRVAASLLGALGLNLILSRT